jgi:hypothetical protein
MFFSYVLCVTYCFLIFLYCFYVGFVLSKLAFDTSSFGIQSSLNELTFHNDQLISCKAKLLTSVNAGEMLYVC